MRRFERENIRLQPFEEDAHGLALKCSIRRQVNLLQVTYVLQGDMQEVSIPPPAERAMRQHGLWEGTCMECFIGEPASSSYREFNFSPAGHWNVYFFEAYRQGMRQEAGFSTLSVDVQRLGPSLRLCCPIDLHAVGWEGQALEIGLAAVLRSRHGQNSYWAAVHPGSRPDFHHRSSFILKLSA